MTAPNEGPVVLVQVLERVSAVTGARYDSAIARELGVTPQTVSSWRKRGTVPYEVVTAFAAKKGLSLNYMLLGKDSPIWTAGEIDPTVAEAIAGALGAAMGEFDAKYLGIPSALPLLGYRLALIYNRVAKRIKPGQPYDDVIADEVRYLRYVEDRISVRAPRGLSPEELAHWKQLGITPAEDPGVGQKGTAAPVSKSVRGGRSRASATARGRASISRTGRKK